MDLRPQDPEGEGAGPSFGNGQAGKSILKDQHLLCSSRERLAREIYGKGTPVQRLVQECQASDVGRSGPLDAERLGAVLLAEHGLDLPGPQERFGHLAQVFQLRAVVDGTGVGFHEELSADRKGLAHGDACWRGRS